MQTALPDQTGYPPLLRELPGQQAALPPDGNEFSVYDDPLEWAAFSTPHDVGQANGPGLWESQLAVRGMHCSACSMTLESGLRAMPGVVSARVSAASKRASVVWSAALTQPSRWMAGADALGYPLVPAADVASRNADNAAVKKALWRWLVAGFCMMQVMMYAFPAYVANPGDITPDIEVLLRWASWLLTLPVVLFSCGPFFSSALRDIRRRSISMDLPVALGIVVTFAISTAATFEPSGWWGAEVYFDSLTMFVFFLLTGRWLEQRLRARTAGALEGLMQRLPDRVYRKNAAGGFDAVPARRLVVGDIVRVLPGEAFPADGTIVVGDTHADEALLTGESRPLARPCGSAVLAGGYNLSSTVQVRVEKVGPSTLYAQIVALMAQASVDKPRLALLADRFARPFLWFVLLAAGAAAIYWWGSSPSKGLMAAVAVLVVTCPCALSLATPAAMLTSAGTLARAGVLVRHLQAIEALAAVDTLVLDKTGTLTEARMNLSRVSTRADSRAGDVLQLAAALARNSLHPVARAIHAAAINDASLLGPESTDLHGVEILDVREIAGKGVEGLLSSAVQAAKPVSVRLGSAEFCGLDASFSDGRGDGPCAFLVDEQGWLARFDLDEALRPEAQEAVLALKAAGLQIEILSGDGDVAVRRIAGRLGVDRWNAQVTPQGKLQRLETLKKEGRSVWMAGDGLNDGPILAGASVSVAVGQAVPLAQAHADFVLPGGQLMMLPAMLQQARRTMRVVRQNLAWAVAYNAVCIPVALAGWMPAWVAGLGMAASSLLVIGNAARLSRASQPVGE